MTTATARVLTVEDDPIVRTDLRLMLEDAGFDVCADARDGVEAVELAREHAPDLIMLDLGLPRLGGVDAARAILSEQDVPIVALTGCSQELAEEAMEAGAVALVRKPFHTEDLVRTAATTLAEHRERRVREESRTTLTEILGLTGYPVEWADELEQIAFASGRVWRRAR